MSFNLNCLFGSLFSSLRSIISSATAVVVKGEFDELRNIQSETISVLKDNLTLSADIALNAKTWAVDNLDDLGHSIDDEIHNVTDKIGDVGESALKSAGHFVSEASGVLGNSLTNLLKPALYVGGAIALYTLISDRKKDKGPNDKQSNPRLGTSVASA